MDVVVGITREGHGGTDVVIDSVDGKRICMSLWMNPNQCNGGCARGPIKEVFIKLTQREARVDIGHHSNDRRSLCVFVPLDVIETWSNEELE